MVLALGLSGGTAYQRRISKGEVDGGGDEHTRTPLLKGNLAQYDKSISKYTSVGVQKLFWPNTTRGRDEGPETVEVLLYIHV